GPLLFAVLNVLTFSLQAQPQGGGSPLDTEASLTVNADVVEAGDFTRYITLSGTIHAWQEVLIAAEVGGYRVEEVLVDVGDYVQEGQELVRLSTALLESALQMSQATLKQREAAAHNAQMAFERGTSLAERTVRSYAALVQLIREAVGAKARAEAARADVAAARLRLQYARVVAPAEGVITCRTVSVGQIAQAGTEMLRLLRQNRVEW